MYATSHPAVATARAITDTATQGGLTINNNIYIFERACDLSQLQNCDLSNSSLHFEGPTNIDGLQRLNLNNATLVFKNAVQSVPQSTFPQAFPTGTQKSKSSRRQKKAALQRLRGEISNIRTQRSDAELKAAMSTTLTNIEHAIHPERLALLERPAVIKTEASVRTPTVDVVTSLNASIDSNLHKAHATHNTELEEGEIVEDGQLVKGEVDISMETYPLNPGQKPSKNNQHESVTPTFINADLKHHGILPCSTVNSTVISEGDCEPALKKIKLGYLEALMPSPFIKSEGD